VKNRIKKLPGDHDLIVCLDFLLDRAVGRGLTIDPEENKTGKWSCLIRCRREIAENRAEIKRLRTLLRLAGIAYTKTGPATLVAPAHSSPQLAE
jgi:hypothetical protein